MTQSTLSTVGAGYFDDTARALELEAQGKPLTKLVLRSGDVVDCVTAVHVDVELDEHGGLGIPPNTGLVGEVPIDPDDPIVEVSGEYGRWFGGDYVLTITFRTRRGEVHGPFGTGSHGEGATPFTTSIPEWQRIRALFGSVAPANNNASRVLSRIGLSLAPAGVVSR
ncbi:jacalin-like lectin [Saccharothrix syringae]|uniref:Jacalin-type lectin domain-containing protein n=1 Tax=Saccharothrix syringae TaxID=103733 RepID=A0A5Q0GWZ7_SACSY|nr:hypothetical protein [Saccharothrix syringae]QFZ18413.1 hypothetical protein EKG83_13795 [Saccharothrix syringae]